MNCSTRISDWVIPQAVASGCFGSGSQILRYRMDYQRTGKDQFSSAVQFLQFTVKVSDLLQNFNVVMKFQPECQLFREVARTKIQFENEVLAYTKILPMIEMNGIVEEIFCKYYCGFADSCQDDIKDFVMLEDLCDKQYSLTSEKVFLDYDHCILALKEIGRFHALSYAAKEKYPSKFFEEVSNIKEKWDADRLNDWKYKFLLCGQRGVLPIVKEQESVKFLEDFLKNYDDPVKFYTSLVKPIEPEAVICHGDFCRNNMCFQYNELGKPVSVKFFDLQTVRYSSPVIDLSFFLLMNTTKDIREKYWDDFLNVYNLSVKSVIPHISVPELDFKRVAVYGYLHCSFFLPMMTKVSESFPIEEFVKRSSYEQAVLMSQMGGESETQLLVDIIRFLLEKNYLCVNYF